RRRVRHPRSARRLALADDRAGAVAGILQQPRLAGRRRHRGDVAGDVVAADPAIRAHAAAPDGRPALMRRSSAFNVVSVALGLAFLYLPIVILVIYSFN